MRKGEDLVDVPSTQVSKLKKQLVSYILKEMKASRISQGEVGRRIGMERTNVNMTLRMTGTNPTLDQLVRIANAIDLNVQINVIKRQGLGKTL